mgnify:CR=1 FL=1
MRIDYNAIKDSVKNVPELLDAIKAQDEKIEKLGDTVVIATEILALAYSANSELVKTGKAKEMPPVNRSLSSREYSIVKQKILAMGFENCNFQSGEAATESFIPNFNLEGVDLL